MRLLDLFCGEGGCGAGYRLAGFEVVGVDIAPMRRNPGTVVVADAIDFVRAHGREFDAVHASPPCQSYSAALRHLASPKAMLIDPVRDALMDVGLPFVIENVVGAPLRSPAVLCGTMFGLPLRRHRLFETSFPLPVPPACSHGGGDINPHRASSREVARRNGYASPERDYRLAMGCHWMSKAGARQTVPPAYTAWIGKVLMEYLECQHRTASSVPAKRWPTWGR